MLLFEFGPKLEEGREAAGVDLASLERSAQRAPGLAVVSAVTEATGPEQRVPLGVVLLERVTIDAPQAEGAHAGRVDELGAIVEVQQQRGGRGERRPAPAAGQPVPRGEQHAGHAPLCRVGDLRGAHTLVGTAIASMNDARRRLCVDGVRELFVRDVLYAAPVDCGGTRVSDASTPIFGLDCEPVLQRTTVQPRGALKLRPENLLAAETAWWTLEHQRETPTDAHADLQFAVERDGVLDGIAVWFDALLANGEWISNSPRVPVRPWGRQLLPLRTPIDVRAGDDVSVSLRFRALDDQYVLRWSVDVTPPAGSGRIGTRVTHSTLEQLTTFPQEMLRRDTAHLPVITRDAALFARLASLATGEHTVARIIDTIYAEMPDLFADRRSAMRRIAAYLELADVSPRVGPESSVT